MSHLELTPSPGSAAEAEKAIPSLPKNILEIGRPTANMANGGTSAKSRCGPGDTFSVESRCLEVLQARVVLKHSAYMRRPEWEVFTGAARLSSRDQVSLPAMGCCQCLGEPPSLPRTALNPLRSLGSHAYHHVIFMCCEVVQRERSNEVPRRLFLRNEDEIEAGDLQQAHE